MSAAKQLFIIILCLCVGFLLNTALVVLLYFFMQGETSYKILLMLSSIISFALPALLAAKFIQKEEPAFRQLGMTESPRFTKYLLAIVFMLAIMPAIEFISSLNAAYSFPESLKGLEEYLRNIDESAMQSTMKALAGNGIGAFILNLIVLAITPAVCEEMFFRGVLQKFFVDNIRNKHIAILLTAFIFSAIHMQFSGLLPRFILGAVLGYLFYSSGSLWLSIVAHATNNALVVIAAFFFGAEISASPDLSAYTNPWWICAIVAGLAIAFFAGRKIFCTKK
jgi:membrane protease YdiL (CAAX protease family)